MAAPVLLPAARLSEAEDAVVHLDKLVLHNDLRSQRGREG